MKYSRLFVIAIIAAIAAMAASTIGLAVDCTRAVVVEENISRQAENTPPLKNWVLYSRNAGNGAFRTGPGTPPSGVGSFELTTPTSADKATLFNYDHIGTALADINKIGYATYRTTGLAQQVAALNIQVDVNGAAPGGFTTLVFEPVYNTNQGVVQDGVWQTWDAYSGGQAIWWSSNPIPGAPNRDTFVSWATIVALNPDAVIVGGFGVNQGSGNPGLISAVDVLTLGSNGDCITYDFEPFRVATTKDDCKNGGYNTVKDAQGNSFKNQGQCIQYVNTGK
jgi:hypothetical protein